MTLECSFPGCDRHPSKGDTIHRISAKGTPFVGRCDDHLGRELELGEATALAAAKSVRLEDGPVQHLDLDELGAVEDGPAVPPAIMEAS